MRGGKMLTMARQTRPLGRPRINRVRYTYRPTLEAVVVERLREQSAQASDLPTTYLERVIGLAHGYTSPYIRPTLTQLPAQARAERLREHVRRLTPQQCGPKPARVPTVITTIRLDEALGDRVDAWCRDHGVDYSSYLRSILRLAAGFDSPEQLRPDYQQPALLKVPARAQERPKAS